VHPGSPVLTDQGQTGGWARRCQPKRPVRTMPVVVLEIDPEDLLQVTTAGALADRLGGVEGLEDLGAAASGMPGPLSPISTRTRSPSRAVRSVSRRCR
jgi:hypothetical protein